MDHISFFMSQQFRTNSSNKFWYTVAIIRKKTRKWCKKAYFSKCDIISDV